MRNDFDREVGAVSLQTVEDCPINICSLCQPLLKRNQWGVASLHTAGSRQYFAGWAGSNTWI